MRERIVNREETRQESSLPLSARVSIVDLAEMVRFWESQGVYIKTMSQLVAWSVSAFVDVLKSNGKIENRDMEVGTAHRILCSKGLYQAKALDRGAKKLTMAIGMGNMRIEGIEPRFENPRAFRTIHNGNSVDALPDTRVSVLSEEQQNAIDEALRKTEGMTTEELSRWSRDSYDNEQQRPKEVDNTPIFKGSSSISLVEEKEYVVKEGMTDRDLDAYASLDMKKMEEENRLMDNIGAEGFKMVKG
jgi:hypothetical protein